MRSLGKHFPRAHRGRIDAVEGRTLIATEKQSHGQHMLPHPPLPHTLAGTQLLSAQRALTASGARYEASKITSAPAEPP